MLRCTPAMAAGVTHRLWDVNDIVRLLEEYRVELAKENKTAMRRGIENSYSQFGDALSGKGVKF
jgi:hypothetical protein